MLQNQTFILQIRYTKCPLMAAGFFWIPHPPERSLRVTNSHIQTMNTLNSGGSRWVNLAHCVSTRHPSNSDDQPWPNLLNHTDRYRDMDSNNIEAQQALSQPPKTAQFLTQFWTVLVNHSQIWTEMETSNLFIALSTTHTEIFQAIFRNFLPKRIYSTESGR